MAVKRIIIVLFSAAMLMLSACSSDEEDIRNLRGDTGSTTSPSAGAETQETGMIGYDYDYDHFSAEKYQAHMSSERKSISEIRESYDKDFDYVVGNPKYKFSFNNCRKTDLPYFDSIGTIKYEAEHISKEDGWKLMEDRLKEMGLYEITDMNAEIYDSTKVKIVDDETVNTKVADVWDDTEGSYFTYFNKDRGYIQLSLGGLMILSKGTMGRYYAEKRDMEPDCTLDPYGIWEGESVESGSPEELAEKEYELIDGKMTVKDAAKIVMDFYQPKPEGFTLDLYRVDICPLEDKYVYRFYGKRVYRNVGTTVEAGNHREYYKNKNYNIMDDELSFYVADSSGVCGFIGMGTEVTLKNHSGDQEKMLGVREAMDAVYAIIANQYTANIDEIRLSYCMYGSQKDAADFLLVPSWEFTGKNMQNGQGVKIYVDALTGEVNFYECRF